MKLPVVLAVLIGTLVLACSTADVPSDDPTPNVDATVEAKLAQERAVDTTVEARANELVSEIKIKDHKFLSIIPLSHAYEHTAGFFLPIYIGAEIYFNENRDQIVNDLLSVKPTLMTAVPRLYEVLYKKINNQLLTKSKFSQKLFEKTIALGTKKYKKIKLSTIIKKDNKDNKNKN